MRYHYGLWYTAGMELLGTLISANPAAVNQSDTATPFTLQPGTRILVHADAATFVKWVSTATGAATSSSYNLKLAAASYIVMTVPQTQKYLSVLSAAGTANVLVSAISGAEPQL
jgi:hypothetical protein